MIRSLLNGGAALLVLVCATVAFGKVEKRRETDTNFENYKPLAAAIAKADKVVLYEGLPHQGEDDGLFDQELKSKKTVKYHGFPFYATPLSLKGEDGKALKAAFADSIGEYAGPKKCEGFHPDYCIEWHVGEDVYRCLVCFGCSEAKTYGPKVELYSDIGSKFKKILKPYRSQRPKSKYDE